MTILITGASRGIGRALLESYEAQGRAVIGSARAPGASDGLRQLDVTDPASHTALAADLGDRPIGLLICNAGIFPGKGDTLETGYASDDWDAVLRTNVTGVFLTIQTLLPNLRAARPAKVAILSSRLGSSELAGGGRYIYRASKAAVLNLGRNLAVDLREDEISLGIYHPGWVRTDMGGPSGEIGVDASVQGLIERFDALGPDTRGCFETWDGRVLPF